MTAVYEPIGVDLSQVDATPKFKLGTEARGDGINRWVYVEAAEAIDQYDAVAIDEDGVASQLTSTEAEDAWKIGAALNDMTAGQFGWVQVRGKGFVNVVAVSADTVLSTSATAGALDDLTTGAVRIQGIVALEANTLTTKTAVECFMAIEPFAELPALD
jgi:hypothetical protein